MINLDTKLLYFINQHHNRWLDPIFFALSNDLTWIIVGVVLTVAAVAARSRRGWKLWFWLLLSLGVIDGFTQFAVKSQVKRVRPCHYMIGLRAPMGCGGRYSFPSNHAANSMGLGVLTWLLVGGRWPLLILLLALATGYSRVYVAVHFPLDVLAGFLEGGLLGVLMFRISKFVEAAIPAKFASLLSIQNSSRDAAQKSVPSSKSLGK